MCDEKIIVVEGKADEARLLRILNEPVKIIRTHGTVSLYKLEELLIPYEHQDIYIFVDADKNGDEIRSLVKKEFPEAIHLYTEKKYKEVETTPYKVLATILLTAQFDIHMEFLY